jgi:hypothetical protein
VRTKSSYHTHATTTELLHDATVQDGLADHGGYHFVAGGMRRLNSSNAVNLTHPSGANIREDFVRAQTFARKDRHGLLVTWNRGEYNAVRHLHDSVFIAAFAGGVRRYLWAKPQLREAMVKRFDARGASGKGRNDNSGRRRRSAGESAENCQIAKKYRLGYLRGGSVVVFITSS